MSTAAIRFSSVDATPSFQSSSPDEKLVPERVFVLKSSRIVSPSMKALLNSSY